MGLEKDGESAATLNKIDHAHEAPVHRTKRGHPFFLHQTH